MQSTRTSFFQGLPRARRSHRRMQLECEDRVMCFQAWFDFCSWFHLQAFQQTHWCRFLRKNFPIRNPSVLWAGKFLMWIQNRHLIISYWMYTFGAPLVASCTAIECFFPSGEPRSRADKLRATWMNCKDRQDCDL
jgi:hypothetical protein